jgi:hypothetical protein
MLVPSACGSKKTGSRRLLLDDLSRWCSGSHPTLRRSRSSLRFQVGILVDICPASVPASTAVFETARLWFEPRVGYRLLEASGGSNTLRMRTCGRRCSPPPKGVTSVRFVHRELQVITRSTLADRVLEVLTVEQGHVGVLYVDGSYVETLSPSRHAFWKNVAKVTLVPVDLREAMHDLAGQEIMTADKVTLRLNAVVTYSVTDPLKVVSIADDSRQALYREAQLALRAVVGTRELDTFLTAKDGVAQELEELLRQRAGALGLEVIAVGIRDVILPGEMKTLATAKLPRSNDTCTMLKLKPAIRPAVAPGRSYRSGRLWTCWHLPSRRWPMGSPLGRTPCTPVFCRSPTNRSAIRLRHLRSLLRRRSLRACARWLRSLD